MYQNFSEFIRNYECTASNSMNSLSQSTKSFPSGHATLSFFLVLFLIWYIERKTRKLNIRYSVSLVYVLLIAWAIFCSASRVTDHRHHWWDVAVGSIYGILTAIYTVRSN